SRQATRRAGPPRPRGGLRHDVARLERRETVMSWLRTAWLLPLLLLVAGGAGAATPADVLIVAVGGDLVSIDPPFSSGAPFQNEVITNLYDYLLEFGTRPDGKGGTIGDLNSFAGKLAQSWTVSPDGTRVTFKLRAGT